MTDRASLVRRGVTLTGLTLGYNILEAVAALGLGAMSGSVALEGFGLDSVIEVTAGGAALWRLHHDGDPLRRAAAERRTHQVVGLCFLALAAWVTWESLLTLLRRDVPTESPWGIALAALSLLVMPALARAKRRVATGLGSPALRAEAKQTSLCAWLSAILLGGLVLNAALGWWWADPLAALAMVPVMLLEGREGLRGKGCTDDACGCLPSA